MLINNINSKFLYKIENLPAGSEIFCFGGGGKISKSRSFASRSNCSAVI